MRNKTRYGILTLLTCLLLSFPNITFANIIYGKGIFVTIGAPGTILTSTDSNKWLERKTNLFEFLNGVAFGKGTFVAVGDHGTIFSSSDGTKWKRQSNLSNHLHRITLSGVTFGNDKFVAVGLSGTILTSEDGLIWTERKSRTASWLYGVTYGTGLFVAVGNGAITTSVDGAIWKSQKSPAENWLSGVTYGNGLFVAVGRHTILTSSDGMAWTHYKSPMSAIYDVIYDQSRRLFVAVGCGSDKADSPVILRSKDGSSWTNESPDVRCCLNAVIQANGVYVAAGAYTDKMDNPHRTILTSTDGIKWIIRHR